MKLTKSRLKRLIKEELDNMASEETSSALEAVKKLLAAKAEYKAIGSRGSKFEIAMLKAKFADLSYKVRDEMKRASEAELNSIAAYILKDLPKEEQEDAIATVMLTAEPEALEREFPGV